MRAPLSQNAIENRHRMIIILLGIALIATIKGVYLLCHKEDSLYLFKKNFARLYDVDFYIGKKVWNEEIYNKLCEMKNVDKYDAFFPAYRKQ